MAVLHSLRQTTHIVGVDFKSHCTKR